ncbi:MAG TPA: HK97 family phage prohead protease [Phycisphaerae bacterium]|nr:HK97 family phage prohead protease [Phycisphaerae bacterium]
MERRYASEAPQATRNSGGGVGTVISGYGAIYYKAHVSGSEYLLWDDAASRGVERIARGALDSAVKRSADVVALFNHDANLVLGRTTAGTLKLTLDSTGLRYEIQPDDTTVARDVLRHLARGDIKGSSFAFIIDEDGESWSQETMVDGRKCFIRTLTSLDVLDVSCVTRPAYTGAPSGLSMPRSGPPLSKDVEQHIAECEKMIEQIDLIMSK